MAEADKPTDDERELEVRARWESEKPRPVCTVIEERDVLFLLRRLTELRYSYLRLREQLHRMEHINA